MANRNSTVRNETYLKDQEDKERFDRIVKKFNHLEKHTDRLLEELAFVLPPDVYRYARQQLVLRLTAAREAAEEALQELKQYTLGPCQEE